MTTFVSFDPGITFHCKWHFGTRNCEQVKIMYVKYGTHSNAFIILAQLIQCLGKKCTFRGKAFSPSYILLYRDIFVYRNVDPRIACSGFLLQFFEHVCRKQGKMIINAMYNWKEM